MSLFLLKLLTTSDIILRMYDFMISINTPEGPEEVVISAMSVVEAALAVSCEYPEYSGYDGWVQDQFGEEKYCSGF